MTSRRLQQPIQTPNVPVTHSCGGHIRHEGTNRYRCERCEQAFRKTTVIR